MRKRRDVFYKIIGNLKYNLFVEHVGLTKFTAFCKQKKVTVYSPKKDLCDKCLAYKNKQIQINVYMAMVKLKEAPTKIL